MKNKPFFQHSFLDAIEPASWRILAPLLLFSLVLVYNPLIATRIVGMEKVRHIYAATRGLVHPTFLNSLVILLVTWLWFRLAGQKGKQIGLGRGKIPEALLILAVAWGSVQILAIVAGLVSGVPWRWNRDWSRPLMQIGAVPAFYLGVGLAEEFLFRGVLFTQLQAKWRTASGGKKWKAFLLALLVSQILFGMSHFYVSWITRNSNSHLLMILLRCLGLGVAGSLFLILYLRSENLWLAAALHGLTDSPFLLMQSAVPGQALSFLVMILVMLFWPFAAKAEALPNDE